MKFIQKTLFYILFIFISEIHYAFTSKDAEKDPISNLSIRENTLCKNDNCIMKCCSFGKHFIISGIGKRKRRYCGFNDKTKVKNADGIFHINMTNFDVKSGIYEVNDMFRASVNALKFYSFNIHLTEHAQLFLEVPNQYNRWTRISNDRFCWDYTITEKKIDTVKIEPGVWILFPDDLNKPSEHTSTNYITKVVLPLSCFFLLLVLVVYALLPEMRTLYGLILMAYVASLLGAFLLLAVIHRTINEPHTCIWLTCIIYFYLLKSSCWLNVMSFDIWWTFREFTKNQSIPSHNKRFKFLMYCLYAWGLPLAMTIMLAVLNSSDMSHVPWFITPNIINNGCFIGGGEKFLYLDFPSLLLILSSWMFYITTAYNMKILNHDTVEVAAAVNNSQDHSVHRDRKSMVRGQWADYMFLWWLSALDTMFIAVSVFFILLCKPELLRKFMKIFRYNKSPRQPIQELSMRKNTSTADNASNV